MNWNALPVSRRAAVLLAVAALALIGAALYVAGKHAWAKERLAELEPRYARLTGIESSGPALDAALVERRATLGRRTYASTMDVARAGSDAQQRARDLLAKAGLDVVSTQVLAPKSVEGFDRIAVVLRADGDLQSLQSALAVLPAQSPTLFVEGMNVQTVMTGKNDESPKLAVQLNVFVLREAK